MPNSLIEAAEIDIKIARIAFVIAESGDVTVLSAVAYHLQQCVEKSLKAILESMGFDYRAYGCSIAKCYRSVLNHVPDVLSKNSIQYLDRNSNVVTEWEVSGRYPSDFMFGLEATRQDLAAVECIFLECASALGYVKLDSSGSQSDCAKHSGNIRRMKLD